MQICGRLEGAHQAGSRLVHAGWQVGEGPSALLAHSAKSEIGALLDSRFFNEQCPKAVLKALVRAA